MLVNIKGYYWTRRCYGHPIGLAMATPLDAAAGRHGTHSARPLTGPGKNKSEASTFWGPGAPQITDINFGKQVAVTLE